MLIFIDSVSNKLINYKTIVEVSESVFPYANGEKIFLDIINFSYLYLSEPCGYKTYYIDILSC